MHTALKGLRGLASAAGIAILVQGLGTLALGPLADAQLGDVTATTAVNIRTAPTVTATRLAVLYQGQSLPSLGSENGWTKVSYNGRTGYVASAYLSGGAASSGPSSETTQGTSTSSTGTVYTTANLNLRSGPSTSDSVKLVAQRGTALTLTGKISGDYAQVTYKGGTYWAAKRYLSATAASAYTELPKVTGKARATVALMMRTTPNSDFVNMGDVPAGTILDVTGTVTNGMAQVIHNGAVRWANNKYLAPVSDTTTSPTAPATPATTTRYATATLNIWTASSGAGNVGELPKGSEIQVTGVVENGRAEAVHNGALRWFTARYVSATPPAAEVKTTTKYATTLLNVWTGSTGTGNVGEVKKGTAIQVTGKEENGRAQAVYDGATRWFTAKYLSTTKPVTTTTKYTTTVLNKWAASTGTEYDGEVAKGVAVKVTGRSANGRVEAVDDGGTFWLTATYVTSVSPDQTLNRGYSSGLDQTNRYVQAIVRDVWDRYPAITTMYGWRQDVTPDHPAGRAVDIMIPSYASNQALGWEIAKYYQAHAEEYNINYIIFAQRIWNIERDDEGWRLMSDRGSDNANHYNHVHITTYDN